MDPQKYNLHNTVVAHSAYQQAMSRDEMHDVKMGTPSPYPASMPFMSGMSVPPNYVQPGSHINQSTPSNGAAPNATYMHPGGYGHQGQSSYGFTQNNSQSAPQSYHSHSAPRHNPFYATHNAPAQEGAPTPWGVNNQRGVPVSTVSTSMPQDHQPWSTSTNGSPSSWKDTQKQENPAQDSGIRKTLHATNHEVLQKWGDSRLDYREWRTQNPMVSYQIDIVESLRFMSDRDRRVLSQNLEKVGWPLRLRSTEELEGRFAIEDTGSQWSQEDNRALVFLRQHALLSWPVLANKFFLGRFAEECERQFNLIKSKNKVFHKFESMFESDLLVEQAGYLENLKSAPFFDTIGMTRFTGPAVISIADAHWLQNYKTSIIDLLTLKGVPLDLDQKLTIRDALQATGWPTNLRSFQKYKSSARDHRGPWNEDDKKALMCLGELLPRRHEMIAEFFPGRTILGIKDRWGKCINGDRTSASPEPGFTPRPEVNLLKTTLLKARPAATPKSTTKIPKVARQATPKAVRNAVPMPTMEAANPKTAWSDAEEQKLFALRAHGKSWSEIAQNMDRSELALKAKFERLKNPAAAKRKEKEATARQKIARKIRKSTEAEDRIDTQMESDNESEPESETDSVATLENAHIDKTKAHLGPTSEKLLVAETQEYPDVTSGDVYMDEADDEEGQEDIWTADEIQRLHQGKAGKKAWVRIQSAHLPNRTVESLMRKWEEITGKRNRERHVSQDATPN